MAVANNLPPPFVSTPKKYGEHKLLKAYDWVSIRGL